MDGLHRLWLSALILALVGTGLLLPAPPSVGASRPTSVAQRSRRLGPGALRLVPTLSSGLATLALLPGGVALPASVLVAGAVWWRSRSWEPATARRRRAVLEAELPHVIDLLSSALTVGAAPAEALSRIAPLMEGPMAEELALWVHRLRWGSDPASVWRALALHPQLGPLGTTLRRATDSGAPVVDALDRLSHDLREQRRAEIEVRVRQVEVRAAVPLGVCLLPAFILLGVVPLVAGSVAGLLAP